MVYVNIIMYIFIKYIVTGTEGNIFSKCSIIHEGHIHTTTLKAAQYILIANVKHLIISLTPHLLQSAIITVVLTQ